MLRLDDDAGIAGTDPQEPRTALIEHPVGQFLRWQPEFASGLLNSFLDRLRIELSIFGHFFFFLRFRLAILAARLAASSLLFSGGSAVAEPLGCTFFAALVFFPLSGVFLPGP